MSKAKRRAGRKRNVPVTMPVSDWDHGAEGQANRIGLVVEKRGDVDPDTGEVVNPNGITGARRVDMLEIYARRGWISTRGYNAGEMIRAAWLGTEKGRGNDWTRERVDSSPKPDASIAIQIDRMSALIRVSRLVPAEDERIVDCVCCQGNAIGQLREYRGSQHERGKSHLRDALERLADRIEKATTGYRIA